MIDAVLSYHASPYTCGVAKFNLRLAKELSVPFVQMGRGHSALHPLYSVKCAEIPDWQFGQFAKPYDLFLHDWPSKTRELEGIRNRRWVNEATRIYAANQVIARQLREMRPDVIEAWCPSTIETPPPRADLTVLTFGMAHKLVLSYFERLRDLLEAHGEQYTILLSTGVHEGTPWDEALEGAARDLRGVFSGPVGRHCTNVEVLGFLSDAALDRAIRAATVCAAFFTPALRANNTTAHAIVERGRPLVTNRDEDSPPMGIDLGYLQMVGMAALRDGLLTPESQPDYSWCSLRTALAEVPCAK